MYWSAHSSKVKDPLKLWLQYKILKSNSLKFITFSHLLLNKFQYFNNSSPLTSQTSHPRMYSRTVSHCTTEQIQSSFIFRNTGFLNISLSVYLCLFLSLMLACKIEDSNDSNYASFSVSSRVRW